MTDFGAARGRKRPGVSPLVWIVVLGILLLLLGSCGWRIKLAEDRRVQDEIAEAEIKRAVETIRASDGVATIDTRPRATGPAGVMEHVLKEAFNRITADNRAMAADLKQLGFPNLISPAELGRPGGVDRAARNLAEARKVVARNATLRQKRIDELKESVRRAPLSPADREDVLLGLTKGIEDSSLNNNRIWKIQDEIIVEFQAALATLQSSRGRWSVSRGQITFSRESDMRAYNDHIYKTQHLNVEFNNLRNAGDPRRGPTVLSDGDIQPVDALDPSQLPPEIRRQLEEASRKRR